MKVAITGGLGCIGAWAAVDVGGTINVVEGALMRGIGYVAYASSVAVHRPKADPMALVGDDTTAYPTERLEDHPG